MPIVLVGVKVGAAALPSFEIEFTALDDDETYTNERKFSSSSFFFELFSTRFVLFHRRFELPPSS